MSRRDPTEIYTLSLHDALPIYVVGKLRIQSRIEVERPRGGHEQRVAVGGRLRDALGRDVGPGSRHVLDHPDVAVESRHALGVDPRLQVGRSSGRGGHDELHRLRGIRLGKRGKRRGGEQYDEKTLSLHGLRKTTAFCQGRSCAVFTHSSACTAASLRTCASVMVCKGLIGTAASPALNSTNTSRPPGLSARTMAASISYGYSNS